MSRYVAVTGTRRDTRRGVVSAELARANPMHVIVGELTDHLGHEPKTWEPVEDMGEKP